MHYLVFGGSKGLGLNICQQLNDLGHVVTTVQRTKGAVGAWQKFDLTKRSDWDSIIQFVQNSTPDHIIYCSGGGPYGVYDQKKFSDHEWAFNLNFLFPAFMIHQLKIPMTFVGSAIAESKPDPLASSYAASKHGLLGLIRSVKAESPDRKIKLFSPGYMDTGMLPAHAWPGQQGLQKPPGIVAKILIDWIQTDDESFHKVVD
jgi:short-subunit dehydrogenase